MAIVSYSTQKRLFWVKKFAKTSFQFYLKLSLFPYQVWWKGEEEKSKTRTSENFCCVFSRVSPQSGWDSFWQTLLQPGGAYLWAILGSLCELWMKVGSSKVWLMQSISNTYSQIRCPYRSQGCLAQMYMSILVQMNLTQYVYAAGCQETR